jgi:hypothetical protein
VADSELPIHWRFAAGRAFAGLRELVWSFDFARLAAGQTYAGLDPEHLVAVIDGFLAEPAGVVFGGDRADLHQLRQALVGRVVPAHREGLAEGARRWHAGDRVYAALPTDELHRLALGLAPADDMLRGWFAEGFCFAYSAAELESLRRGTEPDPRPPG